MTCFHRKHYNKTRQRKAIRRSYHNSHASKVSDIASQEDWELPDTSSKCPAVDDPMTATDGLHLCPYYRSLVMYSSKCSRDIKGPCGKRLVLWAAANGDTNLMALLLGMHRSDLSFTNYYGQTALSLAAEHGHKDALQLLIERSDIDLNTQDIDGQSPLAWAAFHGHFSIVDMLLDRDDLDANSKDVDGNTPLAWATANGHYGVAEALLKRYDVEIRPINNFGETPRDLARRNGHHELVALLTTWSGDEDEDSSVQIIKYERRS